MTIDKYSFLLGAPDQLAAEALANEIAAAGYEVRVDVAPGDRKGGWPFDIGVWFSTDDPEKVCGRLAEAARHHGGGAYDLLEAV